MHEILLIHCDITASDRALLAMIIGNIEPKLRSSLRNIQLIACVKAPLNSSVIIIINAQVRT